MANDKMDDNKRGLSPEEMDAIFEKYENGEISEAELADAISNASTDTNFTDDFSDKFFTDRVNIDPNTIQEESIEQAVRGTVDDDVDDPFNGTRDINENESFAGSGKAPSKKQDIEENEDTQGQDSTPKKRPGKKSVKKRPGKKSASAAGAAGAEGAGAGKKAAAQPSTNPFNQEVADSRKSSSDYSSPFDDEDTEVDEELREEVDDEFEADLEDELEQEELEQESVEHEDLLGEGRSVDGDGKPSHSPFDSPVTLNDTEKSRITPGARGSSVPNPFNEKNSKGGKTSKSGSDKNSSTRSPFGDPSGLGSNARDANIGKKKAPNIWAQRFAALTAASQSEENSEQEDNQNMQGRAPDNNQEVPQDKKKKSKAPAIIALLLAAVLLLPMSMMMSGTMVSNQVVGAGGTCADGVDGNDISGKGSRGVPKGKKSNPEIMPPGVLTSGFGIRKDPFTGEDKSHKGQDLSTGGENVGIYAYYDGVVSVVCKDCNPGGFGSYVVIDHKDDKGDPFTTLYGHMYTKDIFVKEGETVAAGQKIALQGSNGGSTGPHLHFEVGPGATGGGHIGKQVDPAPYLEDTMNPTEDGRGSGGSEKNDTKDDEKKDDEKKNDDGNKNEQDKPTSDKSESNKPSKERSANTGKGNAEILNEEHLKTNAKDVAHIIADRYPEIKTIGGWRESDPFPDHPSGLALDIMIPDYNTPGGKSLGTEINDFLLDNADKLQTNYTIWRQHSYHLDGSKKWMNDRGGDTANHMDHVHVLFNSDGNVVDPGGGRTKSDMSGGNCCGTGRASSGEVSGLTDDENNPKDVKEVMKTNAATIISMGKDKDMNENSIKSLLAIANKQSGLRNLANKGENFSHTNDGGTNQEDLQKSLDKEHDGITDDSNKLGVFLLPPSDHDSVEDLMDVNYQSGLLFDKIKEKNLQDKNVNEIAKELGFPDGDYENSIKDVEIYYNDNKDDAENNAKGSPTDNSGKCENIEQGDSSWNGSGKIKGDSDVPDDLVPIFNEAANEAKNDFITPALLAAIAYTENGFKNEGCSNKGACGLMQFMPDSWSAYGEGGLENRSDPKKAVKAAVKHLDANYDMITGWEKEGRFKGNKEDIIEASIAGYNGGPAYADKNYSAGCGVKPDDKPRCWPAESEEYVHKVKKALENFSE